MATIPGSVTVTGFIAPTDTADSFPTHDSIYGKGGHREVETLALRDAISNDRRSEGMIVWVKETEKYYGLIGGKTNDKWVDFGATLGGGTEFDPTELLDALRQGDPISAICSFPGRLESVFGLMRFYPHRNGKFASLHCALGYPSQGNDLVFEVVRHKSVGSGNNPVAYYDMVVAADPTLSGNEYESFDSTIYQLEKFSFTMESMKHHKIFDIDIDFLLGDFFTINIIQVGVVSNPGSHLTINLRG